MPMVLLTCDPVNLSISNQGVASCEDASNNPAWVSVDAEVLSNIFPPLTYQEGFEIAGGIIALWALCWVARMIIQTIRQTRYG